MLVEELLQRSYWTASELLLKVYERLCKNNHNTSFNDLKEKFDCLVTAKYLIRLPHADSEEKPMTNYIKEDSGSKAKINLNEIIMAYNTKVKNFSDKNVYWTVNFDRFHQDMRDKLIVNAFIKKFDANVGTLVEFILQQMYIRTEPWVNVSNPIPILDVKDIVKKQKLNELSAFFDQYLTIIGMFICTYMKYVLIISECFFRAG